MPGPMAKMKIDVKQKPGMSYPKPASHVQIEEERATGTGTVQPPPVYQDAADRLGRQFLRRRLAVACDDECQPRIE